MNKMLKNQAENRLRENMLHAAVEAALGGHDLESWEQVDNAGREWQAACRLCGMTTWVSHTVRYSVLGDICPGRA